MAPAFLSKLTQTIQVSTEKGKLMRLPLYLNHYLRQSSPDGKGWNKEEAKQAVTISCEK